MKEINGDDNSNRQSHSIHETKLEFAVKVLVPLKPSASTSMQLLEHGSRVDPGEGYERAPFPADSSPLGPAQGSNPNTDGQELTKAFHRQNRPIWAPRGNRTKPGTGSPILDEPPTSGQNLWGRAALSTPRLRRSGSWSLHTALQVSAR